MRRGSLERAMRKLDVFSVCMGTKQPRAREATKRVLKVGGGRCVDTNALEDTLHRAYQRNVSAQCISKKGTSCRAHACALCRARTCSSYHAHSRASTCGFTHLGHLYRLPSTPLCPMACPYLFRSPYCHAWLVWFWGSGGGRDG